MIQLYAVIAGLRTEYAATTLEQRRVDITATSTAAAFLATEFACRTSMLTSFL